MNPIKHLIILMMENRSFDHYLGALALEGRTDVTGHAKVPRTIPDANGKPVSQWCMDDADSNFEIPHGWNDIHADWADGQNNGFVSQFQKENPTANPNLPMGYYTRKKLPVLYSLADHFTVCDRWFGSMLSSTWPNRKYLHSGTRDDDRDTEVIPGFPGFKTTPIYDVIEDADDPDHPGHRLTWKSYFSDVPFIAFWYPFAATHALHNFSHVAAFADDCREGVLPTFSLIDPPFSLADDHPPHDPALGQKFIGLIVDALTHSDSWKDSAMVILYDESGGFYDHVAPPAPREPNALDSPWGFRVPSIVVSPYAKRGIACNVELDHTAIMASIASRWGVQFDGRFGTRWKSSPTIWDTCFDFERAPLPVGDYTSIITGSTIAGLDWGSGVHNKLTSAPGFFETFLERIFILPELKALDRRALVFSTLDMLEHNVITIKRMVKHA